MSFAVPFDRPARPVDKATPYAWGSWLRDVIRDNASRRNFRLVAARRDGVQPAGRRLRDDRPGLARREPRTDEHLAPDGRAWRCLSETLPGMAGGVSADRPTRPVPRYEAFIHVVDSMFNQHAKWLKMTREYPVAATDRLAELPVVVPRVAAGPQRVLAPGPRVHRHVVNKKAAVIRVYLPPDANALLSVTDHCLRSSGLREHRRRRQAACPRATSSIAEAVRHCTRGIGIWDWASNDEAESRKCARLLRGRADPIIGARFTQLLMPYAATAGKAVHSKARANSHMIRCAWVPPPIVR